MEYAICQMCDGTVHEDARRYGIHLCPKCSMLEIRDLNEQIKKKDDQLRRRNLQIKELRKVKEAWKECADEMETLAIIAEQNA